jgi:hypothetical protein
MDRELEEKPTTPQPSDSRSLYYDFFKNFRDYLAEYIRETVTELCISELPINGTVKLFDGLTQGKVVIKNQGVISCYVSTNPKGGFRLDPGEKEEIFINNQLFVTTLSGITTIGFIKN